MVGARLKTIGVANNFLFIFSKEGHKILPNQRGGCATRLEVPPGLGAHTFLRARFWWGKRLRIYNNGQTRYFGLGRRDFPGIFHFKKERGFGPRKKETPFGYSPFLGFLEEKGFSHLAHAQKVLGL